MSRFSSLPGGRSVAHSHEQIMLEQVLPRILDACLGSEVRPEVRRSLAQLYLLRSHISIEAILNEIKRVYFDLGYTVPPRRGGHSHGEFTVHRHRAPPHGGGGFDQSHPGGVSALAPAF